VNKIHDATMAVLTRTGMWVGSEKLLTMASAHGLKTGNGRVYFSEAAVNRALETVGRRFTLMARNPLHSIDFRPGRSAVGMGRSAPFVMMSGGGRREATAEDFVDLIKLGQSLDEIQLTGPLVTPMNLPQKERVRFMTAATIRYSDKPYTVLDPGDLELIALAFGTDALTLKTGIDREEAYGHTTINCMSPLAVAGDQCDLLVSMAENGIPIIITPCAAAGSSGPCSLTGTLMLCNCEVLGVLVLTQLIRPGLPVFYGALPCGADMRSMGAACGGSEARAMEAGTGAMAAFYGLLSRTNIAGTDAHDCDYQAGAEAALNVSGALQSGHHFLTGCGLTSSMLSASREKLLLDAELFSFSLRSCASLTDSGLEDIVALIHDVGPKGTFVTAHHTFDHFKRELYHPRFFTRCSYDRWARAGRSLWDTVSGQADRLLSSYSQPPIDAEVDRLLAQVARP
jgi:trimethylamine--corrinoid protein Co-methyltransferase